MKLIIHVILFQSVIVGCFCLDVHHRGIHGLQYHTIRLLPDISTQSKYYSEGQRFADSSIQPAEGETKGVYYNVPINESTKNTLSKTIHEIHPLLKTVITRVISDRQSPDIPKVKLEVENVLPENILYERRSKGIQQLDSSPQSFDPSRNISKLASVQLDIRDRPLHPPLAPLSFTLPSDLRQSNKTLLPIFLILQPPHLPNHTGQFSKNPDKPETGHKKPVKVSDLIKALRYVDNLRNRIKISPPPEIPRRVIDQKLLMLERIYSEISSTLTTMANRTRKMLQDMVGSLENWDKIFKKPTDIPVQLKGAMEHFMRSAGNTGRSLGGKAETNFRGLMESIADRLRPKWDLMRTVKQIKEFFQNMTVPLRQSPFISQVRKTSSFISWVTSGFQRFNLEDVFDSLQNMTSMLKKMFRRMITS